MLTKISSYLDAVLWGLKPQAEIFILKVEDGRTILATVRSNDGRPRAKARPLDYFTAPAETFRQPESPRGCLNILERPK
jgi:hypothetical protein